MMRISPGRVDNQVSRAQAQNPMAKEIAALLLDRHAGRVEGLFSASDLRSDFKLAGSKNHVKLLIKKSESNQPDKEQYRRNKAVSRHINAYVQQRNSSQDRVPQTG